MEPQVVPIEKIRFAPEPVTPEPVPISSIQFAPSAPSAPAVPMEPRPFSMEGVTDDMEGSAEASQAGASIVSGLNPALPVVSGLAGLAGLGVGALTGEGLETAEKWMGATQNALTLPLPETEAAQKMAGYANKPFELIHRWAGEAGGNIALEYTKSPLFASAVATIGEFGAYMLLGKILKGRGAKNEPFVKEAVDAKLNEMIDQEQARPGTHTSPDEMPPPLPEMPEDHPLAQVMEEVVRDERNQTLFGEEPPQRAPLGERVAEYEAKTRPAKAETAVVDEAGAPKRVYHGTNAEFAEFEPSASGGSNLYGPGFYFTESPDIAHEYAFQRGEGIIRTELTDMKEIKDYFTPGNIVDSYGGGKDKVVSFREDKNSAFGWQVIVEDVKTGERRAHATNPTVERRSAPNIRPAFLEIKNPIDMDAAPDPRLLEWFIKKKAHEEAVQEAQAASKNGQGIDLKASEKTNADMTRQAIAEEKIHIPTNSRLHVLMRDAFFENNEEGQIALYKQQGYDGVTHVGGHIIGDQEHRVWIAWDKAQVKPWFEAVLGNERGAAPAITKAAEALNAVADDVEKVFTPYTRGAEAKEAAGIIREHAAAEALAKEQMGKQFKKFGKEFEKLSDKVRLELIDAVEHGESTGNAAFDSAFATMRSVREKLWKKIQEMKGTDAFVDNYFPHFWENPDVASKVIGRRPLAGPASFLKERKIPTVKEGLDLGLKLKTTNPVELEVLKISEMLRFIKGQEIFGEFKESGLAKFVKFGESAPEGFVKINDKIARSLQFSEVEKGFILRGEYYAPEPAARVLNNYLSPGLWGRSTIYGLFRKGGNFMNQVQLGLSAFHFVFTSIDAVTSRFALGVQELARGQVIEGLKHVSPTNLVSAPIEMYLKGSRVLKGVLGGDPEFAHIVDALIKGGGRLHMDPFYHNSAVGQFWKALGDKKFGKAGMEAIPAAIEALAKPVMEHWVPRMKLAIFTEMAESQMKLWERMGAEPAVPEMRQAYGKMWDSVDNRMGQLVYDNLFWNKVLKDASMGSVRSLGWNIGTIREIGGGVGDLLDIKVSEKGGVTISPRTAYLIALPFVTAMYGAMYQYIKTGEGPQEFRDLYFPKTGRKTYDGRDERVSIPAYIKDIYAYAKHPFVTAGHKLHPIFATIAQMLDNKDYYGVMVRNPDDPLVKQLKDTMSHIAVQFTPFSIRGAQMRAKSGAELGEQAESFFGLVPAPKAITQTPAEAKLDEIAARHHESGPITREEQLKIQTKSELSKQLRDKDLTGLREAILESGLQPAEFQAVLRNSLKPYQALKLVKATPVEAMQVWRVANSDEKKGLYSLILRKVAASKIISPQEKLGFVRELRSTR